MRNLRKLVLLAVMAVAAMAFGASSASAQLSISEEGGAACPAVSLVGTSADGGCMTHATSEGNIELRKHVFGIESHITTCTNEFHGHVNASASGYIVEQVLAGASCSRRACIASGSEPTPWAASGFEGTPQGVAEGTEFLTTNFCVEPLGGGTDETCEIDVPFQSYENQHRQEYGHAAEMSSHGISGFRCELVGHWNSETGGTHDGRPEQEGVVTHVN